MPESIRRSAFLGAILIGAGVLFLLGNLGVFDLRGWLIGGLFILGGLFFLSLLFQNQSNWWAIIPGVVLIDLGGLIILSSLLPRVMDDIGGAFFLGGISLAFWLVFLRKREFWWAIIPAGVLLTLAAITVIDLAPIGGTIVPATLFLGIAATFVLVYLLGGKENNLRWAWYPAIVCAVIGSAFLFFAGNFGRVLMPIALIVLGLFLVAKTLVTKNNQ